MYAAMVFTVELVRKYSGRRVRESRQQKPYVAGWCGDCPLRRLSAD